MKTWRPKGYVNGVDSKKICNTCRYYILRNVNGYECVNRDNYETDGNVDLRFFDYYPTYRFNTCDYWKKILT